MNREYHSWFSPSLNRDMDLLVFGHAGARMIVFPTSMGRFFQWEDTGMIAALGERIEQGHLQLFCVDSFDAESWYAKYLPPDERARQHERYNSYLLDEVVPFTRRNPNPYLMTAGASFGAYHAVNFAFRYPPLVDRVIGLSGLYNITNFTGGYGGDGVYFNNPCAFIKNEHDPARLEALRHLDIILAIGRDDPSCYSNEELSSILWEKNIWHALRIWDGWAHDWPWWKQMIDKYIDGHD